MARTVTATAPVRVCDLGGWTDTWFARRGLVVSIAVRPGATARELTLAIGWGAQSRVDLEAAGCADPDCEADHGYTGSVTADDITVRLSSDAEGAEAVGAAVAFARSLSAATAQV